MKTLKRLWRDLKDARFVFYWSDRDGYTDYEVDRGEFSIYAWQVIVVIAIVAALMLAVK